MLIKDENEFRNINADEFRNFWTIVEEYIGKLIVVLSSPEDMHSTQIPHLYPNTSFCNFL